MATFDETQSNYDNLPDAKPQGVAISDEALAFAVKNGMSESQAKDPYLSETLGAAFRSSNTVGSASASEIIAQKFFPTPDSPALTPEEVVSKMKADGLLPVAPVFDGVKTQAQYDAAKFQIQREYKDRQILDASGWTGTFAQMGASILDLPSLIPVGGEATIGARAADAGMNAFMRRGVSSLGRGALEAGALGATSELGLQATQQTRTPEESVMNVGGGMVLGSLLHFGVSSVIGRERAAGVSARIEADIADNAAGNIRARSAGAAAVDGYIGQLGSPLVNTGGFATVARNTGAMVRWLPFGVGEFVSDKMRNPTISVLESQSPLARITLQEMVNNQWPLKENIPTTFNPAGMQAPKTIWDHSRLLGDGPYAEFEHQAQQSFKANSKDFEDLEDFGNRINHAMINGDVDPQGHPAVTKMAKLARETVVEPIRDELIKQGRLPEEWSSPTAISYVTRMWNREAIRDDEPGVKKVLEGHFTNQINEEIAAAQRTREGRNSDVTDARDQASELAKTETAQAKDQYQTATAEAKGHIDNLQQRHEQLVARKLVELKTERTSKETAAKTARDQTVAKHKASRDERLSGDGLTAKQKTATRQQFKDEVAKEDAKLADALDKIKNEYQGSTTKRGGVVKGAVAKAMDELKAKHEDNTAPHREAITAAKATREESIAAAKAKRDATHEQIAKDNPTASSKYLKYAAGNEIKTDLVQRDASDLADTAFNHLSGRSNDGLELDWELNGGSQNYLKGRKIMIPDEDLIRRGWLHTNIFHNLDHYARTAGHDAALGKVFTKNERTIDPKTGKPYDISLIKDEATGSTRPATPPDVAYRQVADVGMKERLKAIQEEYNSKIDMALNRADKDALEKERNLTLETLQGIRDIYQGKYRPGMTDKRFNRVTEMAGIVNYLRSMGTVVVSGFTDPFNLVVAHGLGPMYKSAVLPIIKNFREAYVNADSITKTSARRSASNLEMLHVGDVAQTAELHTNDGNDRTLAFMRNAARKYSKLSGIAQWTSFMKQMSHDLTMGRILDASQKGWDKLGRADQTWLNTLTIGPDTLAKIKDEFANQTVKKDSIGRDVASWYDWKDKDTAERFAIALDRESVNAIRTRQPGDLPLIAHTPVGRAVAQFRGFMIGTHGRVMGRNIALANAGISNGEYGRAANVAVGVTGMIMMGALIDGLKQAMTHDESPQTGFDKYIQHAHDNPGAALYDAMDRSAVLGLVTEYSNIANRVGLPNGRSLLSYLGHDKTSTVSGKSNMFSQSPFVAIGGPSAGLIEDGFGAAKGFADEALHRANPNWSPGMTRKEMQNFRRLLPGQNLPIIQQLLDMGVNRIGELHHWAPPKPSYQ